MSPPSEYVDAPAALALLGVQASTLYAYASRGLIRRAPGPDGRRRLYHRADLERLRARHDARSGHGPTAAAALRWGEPVLASAITAIDPLRGPLYRGEAAVALALADRTIESVAERLWASPTAERSAAARWRAAARSAARPGPGYAAALPRRGHPHARMAALITRAALDDDDRFDAPLVEELSRGRRIMHLLVHALAPRSPGPSSGRRRGSPPASAPATALAPRIAQVLGLAETPLVHQAIDAALVLMADHELNASSFAARVAASTGADLYMCVTAALATVSGPEHGSAPDRVEALIAEIGKPERATAVVRARARRGESVPGFGHRLYAAGDPRTPPLLARAQDLAPRSTRVRTLLALVEVMADAGHPPPSADIGLVAIAEALRMPPGSAGALFALGRSAGWIAHALEQRAQGFMVRPRARYVGR